MDDFEVECSWLYLLNLLDRHTGSAILNFLNLNEDLQSATQKPQSNNFQVNLIKDLRNVALFLLHSLI